MLVGTEVVVGEALNAVCTSLADIGLATLTVFVAVCAFVFGAEAIAGPGRRVSTIAAATCVRDALPMEIEIM